MSSQSTTQENSLSGETHSSPLQYGSMSNQNPVLDTFKVTSSLVNQSGSDALQKLLASARTLSAAEARKWKPSHTAPSKIREWKDHGDMESQQKGKVTEPIWINSDEESLPASPFKQSQKNVPDHISNIGKGLLRSKKYHGRHVGESAETSTSSEQQVPAKRRLFTSFSDTNKYTLWQAKNMAGSMGIKVNTFSYLTSMRASLNQKRSMSSWMGIHTDLLSKEGSVALAIISELLSPMSHGVRDGPTQPFDASNMEASTDLTGDIDTESPMSSGHNSANGSSEEDQSQFSSDSSQEVRVFYDDEADAINERI